LHINGDYTQLSAGKLYIELAPAGTDTLDVTGTIMLAGTLEVVATDGYSPMGNTVFPILTSPSPGGPSISGTFSTINLPTFAGFAWDTTQLYTAGYLLLTSTGLPGDFNSDGTVDTADYVVWRKNDGTPAGYIAWQANFGATAGSAAADVSHNPAFVPEPSAVTLLGACIAAWLVGCGPLRRMAV
jgi:hypothetical protein